MAMLVLSQTPNGALSARRCPSPSNPSPSNLFSKSRPRLPSRNSTKPPKNLILASSSSDAAGDPGPSRRPVAAASSLPSQEEEDHHQTLVVVGGNEGVPPEGVIQLDRPDKTASQLLNSAQVALLAGGDVLCLLMFSAIGRFSHGFSVIDIETIHTADPFVAGWFLSAYFLGGYGDDGKGVNGLGKTIVAAVRSWAVGIPLGIAIRAATSGHIPSTTFMLIAMGSTGILLIGWRALSCNILRSTHAKRNDIYKRGSPFELFGLLTSLIRRW